MFVTHRVARSEAGAYIRAPIGRQSIIDRRMTTGATPPKKPLSETVRQLGALSTVGFSFVLAVGLGVWAGLTLDRWLDTSPWFFFIFFAFGLTAGILNVYRTAGKFLK